MTLPASHDIEELRGIIAAGPGTSLWNAAIKRHYEVLLVEAICVEIGRLTRKRNDENILGWSNWDSDADLAAQIADLRDELADLTEAEPLPLSNERKEAA